MTKKLHDIFDKAFRFKWVWVGVLACACVFCFGIGEVYAEGYECPTMDELRERYQSKCFACQIVKVLIASFMQAASMVYDVSRDAGVKLLVIGAALWTAFWALKKVSSLTSQEPMNMMNELIIMMFKVLVAYVFITAGAKALVSYAINPIMGAGADFGIAMVVESDNLSAGDPSGENAYNGPTDIVSANLMNKILRFSEGVSNEVAKNLIIGNALTCFSIKQGINWNFIIEIHIPDIWLWLCGAAIWIVGLLLTITVCYYLIDIPFKLGFAIIALPVVIGLWPFDLTKDKFKDCMQIIFNATATFVFLAISTSYAMVLMDEALGNIENLEAAFEKDDVTYVSDLFDITGSRFLIIMFCYIYGFKMIGDFTKSLPDKFVGAGMGLGSGTSPMHHTATAATMWLGNKALAPVKMATDIAAHQGGKLATGIAAGVAAGAGNVVAAGGRTVLGGGMKAFKNTKIGGAITNSKVGQKIGMDKWDDKLLSQPKAMANRMKNAFKQANDDVIKAKNELFTAIGNSPSKAHETEDHRILSNAIANEEINSVKHYSNEDLGKILDYQSKLLSETDNATAFESLHENSVSDLKKFADGQLSIETNSYENMQKFINTFGTNAKGELIEEGLRAQKKLNLLKKLEQRYTEFKNAGKEFYGENIEGIQNTKKIYDEAKGYWSGLKNEAKASAAETVTAAAGTAQSVVTGASDIKNTAATYAAKGAHSLRHIPGVGAAAGFIGGGLVGGGIATVRSAVRTGLALKDTLGGAARTVASPVIATGGVVNQIGKTIDNAFKVGDDALYTLGKGVQTGGQALLVAGRFAEVGYHRMATSRIGKKINKAANVTGKSLKVGGKLVMVFAKTLDATRGKGTRQQDVDLSKSKFFSNRNAARAAQNPERDKNQDPKRTDDKKDALKNSSEKVDQALRDLEQKQKELEEAKAAAEANAADKTKEKEEAERDMLIQQEETRRTCVQFKEEMERSEKIINERIKAIEEMSLEEQSKHATEKYNLQEKKRLLTKDMKMIDDVLDMVAKGTKAETVYRVYKGL